LPIELSQRLGWKNFNRVANFLKHAEHDADADTHRTDTEMGIGFACILYARIARRMTPEMRAFDMWMHIMHPDNLPLPLDPDADIESGFLAIGGEYFSPTYLLFGRDSPSTATIMNMQFSSIPGTLGFSSISQYPKL